MTKYVFDLCNTGWALYEKFAAASDADKERAWREFVNHRNSCPDCPDYVITKMEVRDVENG